MDAAITLPRSRPLSFQAMSHITLVLLAFLLPLSTGAMSVLFPLAVISSFLAGDFKGFKAFCLQNQAIIALFGFLSLFILGLFYTDAPLHDIGTTLRKMGKLLYFPLLIPSLRKPEVRRHCFYAFILSMVVTVFFGMGKVYAGLPIGLHYSNAAVFKDHIQTNFLMALAAFFLVKELHHTKGALKALFIAGIAVMTFYVWFMSEGRSGYVIYTALLGLYALQRWGWKSLMVSPVVAAALFGMAYMSTDTFHGRIAEIGGDYAQFTQGYTNTSVGQRLGFYQNSLKLLAEKPYFGWGTGSFAQTYRDHYGSVGPLKTRNPHNEYLMVGVQLGMMGVVGLVVLFVVLWQKAKDLSLDDRTLAEGVILAIALGSLINSWLSDTTENGLFSFFMALSFASLYLKKR